ncbi:MAG TPA: GDSL-type esterase/lipase family protein [Candidatus Polarisedimenticolaceae bacterium]|nr:GDSL-type esterase/lipase family protein [Candidatus Polarisedimenticolaceae bacterium]
MRVTPVWKKVCLAIAAPIVFVAVAECGLWLLASAYRRDAPQAETRPSDSAASIRILALGDSFTYGLYVDGSESYPAQLRRRLAGAAVAVDAVGRPGASPTMLLDDVDSIVERHRPDVVLLLAGYNINDDDIVRHRERNAADGRPSPATLDRLAARLQRLRTFRLLGQLAIRLRPATDETDPTPRGRMQRFDFRAYQEVNRSALRELAAALLARGVRVVLLNYPQAPVPPNPAGERHEYYYSVYMKRERPLTADDYLEPRRPGEIAINAVIRRVGEELALPLVDNFRRFESLADKTGYFVRDDEHPNGRGYAILADEVERSLVEHGLLSAPGETAADQASPAIPASSPGGTAVRSNRITTSSRIRSSGFPG